MTRRTLLSCLRSWWVGMDVEDIRAASARACAAWERGAS